MTTNPTITAALAQLLADARYKLQRYREEHSGTYVGGREFYGLVRDIDEALALYESSKDQPASVAQVTDGLLPCPFCGGEPAFNFWLGDVKEIYCKQCLAAMQFRCQKDWIAESTMQWNRRAPLLAKSEPGDGAEGAD